MRDDFEYKELSKGFDFLFDDPQELELLNAQMQIQGVLIEMYSIMSNFKDKTSENYKSARTRWLTIQKAIAVTDLLWGKNRLLKHKLLVSENELANYKFIYGQIHGDAKIAIRSSDQTDKRIPYPDNT